MKVQTTFFGTGISNILTDICNFVLLLIDMLGYLNLGMDENVTTNAMECFLLSVYKQSICFPVFQFTKHVAL